MNAPCLEVVHEVGAANLRVGALLVATPVQDGTGVAGRVHPPRVPYQHDNL